MAELPKAYAPNDIESRWYSYWYDHHLYDAEARSDRPAFTVVMPPPNVTGILTMGHIINNTLQDIYVRWHRMRGFEACWIPGTDHAGIATQGKIVKALKDEGVNFRDLGREGFLERAWAWTEQYGGIIFRQLRSLGVSVDWRRERFTMEADLSQAVTEVFVRLYDAGLIYRGKRIVNWSPLAQTTLSDEEVLHREVVDRMYTLRYHLADGSGTVLVATARPETLFGDVAVAVNPNDGRYTALIGRTLRVPLADREVPIIADSYADPAFGTGAVKITPAHDPNDYEVGTRHNLAMPNTINPDGSMNELAGPLAGMDRFDARRRAVEMLRERDLIERDEEYTHSVGYSERGGEQVEPYLSDQWFVRMEPLAQPALEAVRSGAIRFQPERWVKTYEHWMTGIRDWAISRQLWWGHRIPVWYTEDGRQTAARSEAEARERLEVVDATSIHQDEDVLDTWFSSWLWPFSVHGWGSARRNDRDLAYFYPTDLLVTGPDIIFFWVARMIMAGFAFMEGEPKTDGTPRTAPADLVPFRTVYFTSIIRDTQGRKMSKSLGNSPDPLDVIRDYGADALRFTIIYLAPSGQDVRFGTEQCELGRNFCNKIWNAGRFLAMKAADAGLDLASNWPIADTLPELQPVTATDRWILSRFHRALAEAASALESYRINDYSKLVYEFVWGEFCDWYVELLKNELAEEESTERRAAAMRFAVGLFDQVLRMLHPIIPFITEELWHNLAPRAEGASISTAAFPQHDPAACDAGLEARYTLLQRTVESVRRMRAEAGLSPGTHVDVTITAPDTTQRGHLSRSLELLRRMARIETLGVTTDAPKPKLSATEVVEGCSVHVHLEGHIDLEKERAKTEKEMERIATQIRATEGKLGNEKFTANAPVQVVEAERTKLEGYRATLEKLRTTMEQLA